MVPVREHHSNKADTPKLSALGGHALRPLISPRNRFQNLASCLVQRGPAMRTWEGRLSAEPGVGIASLPCALCSLQPPPIEVCPLGIRLSQALCQYVFDRYLPLSAASAKIVPAAHQYFLPLFSHKFFFPSPPFVFL